MLQAATGKLFTNRENPRRKDLKGVIDSKQETSVSA
jgi:hypothetical protein